MTPTEGRSRACIYQEPHLPFGAMGVAWPHSAAHWRPRHCHRELELNLVTRGRGRFALDGGEHELGPGELLWFLPYTAHELVSVTADFDMWVMAFRPDLVERLESAAGSFDRAWSAYRSPSAQLEAAAFRWLDGALRSAFQLLCSGRAPDPALMARVLCRASSETAHARGQSGAQLHSVARRARRALSTEPWLSRSTLAARLSVSESTVAHVFRRDLGVTLDEYRNRVRVGRLFQVVDDRPTSLLDAALAAGFGSAAQYHRCVRALADCRPSELRSPAIRRALSERVRDPRPRSAD